MVLALTVKTDVRENPPKFFPLMRPELDALIAVRANVPRLRRPNQACSM